MPAPHFSWPSRAMKVWRTRAGYSSADVAELLRPYGVEVTEQAVSGWCRGEVGLQIGVVACLCQIDPAHADVWHEAFRKASGADLEPEATEDHLPLRERVRRALRQSGEGTTALADLLDGYDDSERLHAIAELRESIAEQQRVLDALAVPQVGRRSVR